ncbi:uncharacterized protein CDAR_543401 [Caerostris darwini]|uniref:Uncharacterized protein n=1 Tax=Caerostris darwini TaxID=1538125 RepID=A0AAV4RWQ0_9ARAC|nr:uncharacterized protein CDAR_543401 [Caerostris darwini]
MALDYSILEEELKNQLADLKRDLHMRRVKWLQRKQYGLKTLLVQRKQIEDLKGKISDLEPTVSTLYSAHHTLKDEQMKGYLIYLLQLKDVYFREVETKKEILRQRQEQAKRVPPAHTSLTTELHIKDEC